MENSNKLSKPYELLLLLLVGLILLVPRAQQLGRYVFIDETYYLKQGAQFYWAIANQEYDQTDLVVHPGVTTNWLGATAFWLFFPEYAEDQDESFIPDLRFRTMLEKNGLSLIYMLIWARRIVVVFNTFLLILAYLLMRQLFPVWLSVLGVMLAGFDPFYFDYSRFLHVDGMLATIMFVALLAFIVYLRKQRWFWLVLSGGLAGLSVLTKVPGMVLLGGIGLFALIDWFYQRDNAFGKQRSFKGLLNLLFMVLVWILVAVAVIVLFWPAMWSDPMETLRSIAEFVIGQGSADIISPMYFNRQQNPTGVFDVSYFYYYPLSYLWRASPVTLAGMALLMLYFLLRKRLKQPEFSWDVIAKIIVFALFFILLMTVSVKKFDRYILPVIPLFNLLAAIGFYAWVSHAIRMISNRMDSRGLRQVVLALAVLVIGLYQGLLVFQVFPYGLSYYNPMMGGGQKADEVMMIGSGEGLDQAAAYMMTIPGKRNLVIYSFYSNVFGFHFMHRINDMPWYPDQFNPEIFEADYWIIYHSQRQRGMSQPALDFVEGHEPEHIVVINGIEYAWIYNLAEIRGD
jgi:hypothetical protein